MGGPYARERRRHVAAPAQLREDPLSARGGRQILTGYLLPDVPFLRLRFALESQGDAWLPPYKGSLLRGAFGHALRRAVCSMGPRQPCETCSLSRACVYTRLFEAFAWPEPPPYLHGQPAAPRPFVFEPLDERRDFSPGDHLQFDLLLFGEAVTLQAFAVLAVERMTEAGLGVGRFPFRLTRASHQDAEGRWHVGYEQGGRLWSEVAAIDRRDALPLDDERLRLHLVTPLRIKEKGRFVNQLTFSTLAFRMLRRALEVAHFHVPGAAVDWNVDAYLEQADAVRVTDAELSWLDWERYSNRQRAKMRLGGVVGALTLEGPLTPFHGLLRAAEVLHVGKGTTFGLGKICVGEK